MQEDNLFESSNSGTNQTMNEPSKSAGNNGSFQTGDIASSAVHYNTNYNTNYNKNQRGKGCLIATIAGLVILILIILSIISSIAVMFTSVFESPDPSANVIHENYVELIKIEGTIYDDRVDGYGYSGYSHTTVLNRLNELIYDSNNKGIVLYVNSGGGGAYQSDELYLALKNYKESTGRPIYAYYAELAASGAVYASMAADEIYANRMTMTGSIGVVMTTYNIKGLLDKLGIEEISIKSGENKAMLSSGSEVTEEQIAILQSLIDESYDIFVNIISEERGIPLEDVYSLADGRLYSPHQALELNLIDGIMTYDEFLSYIESKRSLKNCILVETQYPTMPIWSNFLFQTSADSKELTPESEILDAVIESTQKSPLRLE